MLAIVQSLDPPGVGARDLRECLMLQLGEAGLEQSRRRTASCATASTS